MKFKVAYFAVLISSLSLHIAHSSPTEAPKEYKCVSFKRISSDPDWKHSIEKVCATLEVLGSDLVILRYPLLKLNTEHPGFHVFANRARSLRRNEVEVATGRHLCNAFGYSYLSDSATFHTSLEPDGYGLSVVDKKEYTPKGERFFSKTLYVATVTCVKPHNYWFE